MLRLRIREALLALIVLAATLAALAASARPCHAHPTHAGTLVAHVKADQGVVDVLFSIIHEDLGRVLKLDKDGNNIVDADELQAAEAAIGAYLDKTVVIKTQDGVACTARDRKIVRVETGTSKARIHLYAEYRCAAPMQTLEFSVDTLFEDEGGYRHYGRIQVGERIVTAAFNRRFPTYTLTLSDPTSQQLDPGEALEAAPESDLLDTVARYGWEGFIHILMGLDHVLFVLALLLVARSFKSLTLVITSFTVGHSITLAISALDVFTLPPRLIESVIALSIIYVVVENALKPTDEPRYRFILTAVFGMIHGFGFSYVLRDEVGLPTDALAEALVSFNLGVEVGQLAVVAVAYPLLRLIMDKDWYKYVVWGGSGLLGAVALFWFVERAFLG